MAPKSVDAAARAERIRVGATLRALRLARERRLGELAGEVGVSHAYLSNIEAGRKPLTDELLVRLSEALGVDAIAIKHPRRRWLV